MNALANDIEWGDLFHNTFDCFSESAQLIFNEGVYPHFYMNSFDKFAEKNLPPIFKFAFNTFDEK